MSFNKKKCLELMKESKKLRQDGKLTQYLILLSDDVFWQSRNKYFQIIKSFLSRSIDIDEFMKQYGQLRRENMDGYDMRKKNLEAEAVKSTLLTILPEKSR